MELYVTAVSFVGSRDSNQDNFLVDDLCKIERIGNICIAKGKKIKLGKQRVFAVSDGMGGLSGGEFASYSVINGLYKYKDKIGKSDKVWKIINKPLLRYQKKKGYRTGATLSACKLTEGEDCVIVNTYTIGDSPIYHFSEEDNEVKLINILDNEAGLTEEELSQTELNRAKRILHHFFGKDYEDEEMPVHNDCFEARPGDVIVIASDGITTVTEEQLCKVILKPKYTNLAMALAVHAIEHSDEHCDNTTVIAIEVAE